MATDFSDTNSELDMECELSSLLEGYNMMDDDDTPIGIASVATFEQCGMLTYNKGLCVRLDNGAEFQIAIVQSAEARS